MRITFAIALCCVTAQAVSSSGNLRRTRQVDASKRKAANLRRAEPPSVKKDSATLTAPTILRPHRTLADPRKLSECVDADGTPLTVIGHDNGHLHSYVSTMTFESWHDAHAAARALRCCQTRGRLLVASDASERDFIRARVVPHEAAMGWVGLVDEANDGVWTPNGTPPISPESSSSSSSSPTLSGSSAGSTKDCGTDPSYDDKDYLYGVRCREAAQLPIIVEFDCPGPR